jgi:ribosomal-protein-serine acetyltransferase
VADGLAAAGAKITSMSSRRPLRTPRLVLEPTSASHAEGMWAAVAASLNELGPWMPWAVDPTRAETGAFTSTCERRWGESLWNFTILLSGEVVGSIGLDDYDALVSSCTLGYWLRSDLAGRGYMTEAAAAVVDFAFDKLGIHRIELQAGVANRASARVAEKVGFRRAGLLRHSSRGTRGWYDSYVFDLLSTDDRAEVPVEVVETR